MTSIRFRATAIELLTIKITSVILLYFSLYLSLKGSPYNMIRGALNIISVFKSKWKPTKYNLKNSENSMSGKLLTLNKKSIALVNESKSNIETNLISISFHSGISFSFINLFIHAFFAKIRKMF